MAYIGFRYPVFAAGSYTDGSAPTYSGGVYIGKGMSGSVNWDTSAEHMYADDVEVETDTSITGGSVSVEVDDIDVDSYCAIFGLTKGNDGLVVDTDASAPYGGFGFIRVKRKAGVRTFEGHWIYKVQFSHSSEDMQTKADRVAFASSSLDGTILGARIDNTGAASFRERKSFDTETAALTWLKGKAGISD